MKLLRKQRKKNEMMLLLEKIFSLYTWINPRNTSVCWTNKNSFQKKLRFICLNHRKITFENRQPPCLSFVFAQKYWIESELQFFKINNEEKRAFTPQQRLFVPNVYTSYLLSTLKNNFFRGGERERERQCVHRFITHYFHAQFRLYNRFLLANIFEINEQIVFFNRVIFRSLVKIM